MKPEHLEKLAREIVQSHRRCKANENVPGYYEVEFRYREGIRRAVSVVFGAEWEHKLSSKVANLERG